MDEQDERETKTRRWLFGDIYLASIIAAVVVSVFSLGLFWLIGDDPATAVLSEPDSLRDELAPLRRVPLDEFVYLNDSSPYRWVLGPGFAPAEDDGTWVRSRVASLIFYPAELPEDFDGALEFELSLSPLLVEGEVSRVVQLSSGLEVVDVELPAQGAKVRVRLPTLAEQTVEIRCDSLNVPPGTAATTDLRRLCVKVYAMAVRPIVTAGQ